MRFFTICGLIFNTLFYILFAGILFYFALHWITPGMVSDMAVQIQGYPNSSALLMLVSLLIVLINYTFMQSVMGKIHREKYIAFTTSSGQVSIALAAVEDLIKRLAIRVPEAKNLRPDVRVRRRGGIAVYLRIDLKCETNIVDLTERLQELVKSKIQDMLRGIDEPIIVKIHVAKIVCDDEKDRKKTDNEQKEQPAIPFYGYGR